MNNVELRLKLLGLRQAIDDLYMDFMNHRHLADGTVAYTLEPLTTDYTQAYWPNEEEYAATAGNQASQDQMDKPGYTEGNRAAYGYPEDRENNIG